MLANYFDPGAPLIFSTSGWSSTNRAAVAGAGVQVPLLARVFMTGDGEAWFPAGEGPDQRAFVRWRIGAGWALPHW